MSNTDFPAFHETHPAGESRVAFDDARHGAFAAKVPAEIANEWRTFGFGPYGGGLIWTQEPDRPVLDHDDWPGLDGSGIEVLRTAFASVCVFQGGNFLWLNVHTGRIASLGDVPQLLFDVSLIHRDFRKDVLREPVFTKIRKRLGDLSADECFGFAPLPALGGDSSAKSAVKVQLREYAAMAGQMRG